MTDAIRTILCTALVQACVVGAVWAQEAAPSCTKIADCSKYYDAAKETQVMGTVGEVVRIPYGRSEHASSLLALRITGETGSPLAYLAPEGYVKDRFVVPKPGTRVSLVAAPILFEGQEVLVVREFTVGADRIALRGRDGTLLPIEEEVVAEVPRRDDPVR